MDVKCPACKWVIKDVQWRHAMIEWAEERIRLYNFMIAELLSALSDKKAETVDYLKTDVHEND